MVKCGNNGAVNKVVMTLNVKRYHRQPIPAADYEVRELPGLPAEAATNLVQHAGTIRMDLLRSIRKFTVFDDI